MADRWRSLCLDQTNVPQLFIRTNIAATGYTIHITDLSRVWGETIREPDIKSRARSSRCSIDPSDGEDQYKILLQKLQEAANQERGTSIALHPGAIDDLILTLTAPLPDPLPDFEWEASLSSLPSHCVKDLVIAPLLAHVSVLQCQIPTLIREIQEKDRVISRLVDRLEQSGNGLVHVFLNVATTQNGSKNMQREQVARYVRGLSPFDEAEWKEKQDSILPSPTPGDKAVCGVLESLRPAIIHTEHAAKSDNWWQNLGNRATHTGGLHREHSASWGSLSKTTASADGSKKEDDGFQRQPTPPHLKKRAAKQASSSFQIDPMINDDISTDDEKSISHASSFARKARQSNELPFETTLPTPKGQKTKIGTIGGKSRSFNDCDKSMDAPPMSNMERDTAIATTAESIVLARTVPAQVAKPRTLGNVGGKTLYRGQDPADPYSVWPNQESRATRQTLSAEALVSESLPSGPEAKSPPPDNATLNRSSPIYVDNPSVKELAGTITPKYLVGESTEELASRRRIELKQQLEQKTKVPSKKKRKF